MENFFNNKWLFNSFAKCQFVIFVYLFINLTAAFELLPYVHIDFLHYSRLAQCQSKCGETYGIPAQRNMNDGSARRYLNISSEHYDICETGCIVHARGGGGATSVGDMPGNSALDAALFDAFRRGQNFWWESALAQNTATVTQIFGKSDLKSHQNSERRRFFNGIRVVCVDRADTIGTDNVAAPSLSNMGRVSNASPSRDLRARYGMSYGGANTMEKRAISRRQLVFNAYNAILSAEFAIAPSPMDSIKDDSIANKKKKDRRWPRAAGMNSTGSKKIETEMRQANLKLESELKEVEEVTQDPLNSKLWREMLDRVRERARYVVLWRQKAKISIGEIVERDKTTSDNGVTTEWITASIESSNTFHVEGIQPGMLYRFMLIPIGVDGRLADAVRSEWIDFETLFKTPRPSSSLTFFSHYNALDQVAAVARWPTFDEVYRARLPPRHPQLNSKDLTKYGNTSPLRFPVFNGCRVRIEYGNGSAQFIEDFILDESDGYTMRNLAYATEYKVKIHSVNSKLPNEDALEGRFTSLSCSQIHGPGSFECDPEPVKNIRIRFLENSTALAPEAIVSWSSTMDIRHILLYHLYCVPVSEGCEAPTTSLFLTANTTEAHLNIDTSTQCEFEVRVINYDLLGRDTSASARFTLNATPRIQSIYTLLAILRENALLIAFVLLTAALCIALFVGLCVTFTAQRNATRRRVWRASAPSSCAASPAQNHYLREQEEGTDDDVKDFSTRRIVEL